MKDILEKLFGGTGRVKLMRLFIFNSDQVFTKEEVIKKTGVSEISFKRDINELIKSYFIKRKVVVRELAKKQGKKIIVLKRKINGYGFEERFPFTQQFKIMLMDASPLRGDVLIRKLTKAGKMKLIVTSGIFIQNPESRLDLLVVGDRLNKQILDRAVHNLESEIGRELRYAVFETADFNYRMSVYDRLVRDVLEYPHEKLVNTMGIGEE